MSASDDIKRFLVDSFAARGQASTASEWKRRSKSTDDRGRTVRAFDHARIGQAEVIEEAGAFSIAYEQAVAPFTAPVFAKEQRHLAAVVHAFYDTIAHAPGDPIANLKAHPDYAAALPALGSRLAFFFPELTYGNEEGVGKRLDDPVGACCVKVFDPTPGADDDLYPGTLIHEQLEGLGLDLMDEYHWEFKDQEQTVRQAVQGLLSLGLRYEPHRDDEEEACLFEKPLKAAGAHRPASVVPRAVCSSTHKP